MSINHKKEELKRFAELILQAEDYSKMIEKFNGYRMGLNNKIGPGKRMDAWKNLFEVYK